MFKREGHPKIQMIRAKAMPNTTAWVLLFELQAYRSLLYESLLFELQAYTDLLYESLLFKLQAFRNLLYASSGKTGDVRMARASNIMMVKIENDLFDEHEPEIS